MRIPVTKRLVGPLVIVGVVAGWAAATTAQADESQELLRDASAKVMAVKEILGRERRLNEEFLASLATAQAAMDALKPPPKPDLVPFDPQAGMEQQGDDAQENKRRLERWTREHEAYRKGEERLRGRWVAVLEEAVLIFKGSGKSLTNIRSEVNRGALEMLVATGRPDAAVAAARAFTAALHDPALRWSFDLIGPLLEALNRLRSLEALDLLRQLLSSRERVMRLDTYGAGPDTDVQAVFLRIIGSYESVPGRLRYLLVRDLVATYEPMEIAAARGAGADLSVWNKIREAAINATWRHAGMPTHDTGGPLASMNELSEWFRAHRSRGDSTWRD